MLRRTLRLSVFEGAVWALMVGLGELFFVADAVRLGADRVFAAAVVIVPLLAGSVGGWLGSQALRFVDRRRPLVCAVVAGQVAVLEALAAIELAGQSTPWVVLAGACAYYVFGNGAGPGWASWMGQTVPRRLRGRYFGRRNRWIHLATFVGLLSGGALLWATERGGWPLSTGYAALFALAALARAVSGALLWASAEGPFERPGPVEEPLPPEARRVVSTSAMMLVAVSVASPFFAPYMLVDLGFDTVRYTLAQAAMVVGKVLALPFFGARVDRDGALTPWRMGATGIAIVPLPWLGASGLGTVAGCQVLSGASWGAYEVAQLALVLGSTSDRLRASVFALQGVYSGIAMATGSLLGTLLLWSGAPMAAVFVTSSALRLLVVGTRWSLPLLVPGRRDAVRIVGLRPQAGPATGPVAPPRRGPHSSRRSRSRSLSM